MGASAIFQAGQTLLPLAGFGLSIPFFGGQQKEDDFTGGYNTNTVGGIYYGPSGESNTLNFQDLINTMRKNPKIPFLNFGNDSQTFNENFLQGKPNDTSGNTLKTDTFTPQLPEGNINYSLVGNQPTEFLSEQNQILGPDGRPLTKASSGSASTTFDNTDISSNNNNNNNNKDGNNVNKLLFGSLLINPLFEGGRYLFDKAKDIFSKDDKDEDDGKSDFEDITGITYEKAMELQRKRENELMNRRALEGGIKDAGKYMYLAGAAGMEAGKNIGRNTQDMLRSMAYGQSALANTIAGASKTTPLARTYFS